MSDTPRTDAAEYRGGTADYDSLGHHRPVMVTPANFARDLERQLAAEREARAYAEKKEADLFAEVTAQQYRADTAEARLAEAVNIALALTGYLHDSGTDSWVMVQEAKLRAFLS